jgi:hypothetical protein
VAFPSSLEDGALFASNDIENKETVQGRKLAAIRAHHAGYYPQAQPLKVTKGISATQWSVITKKHIKHLVGIPSKSRSIGLVIGQYDQKKARKERFAKQRAEDEQKMEMKRIELELRQQSSAASHSLERSARAERIQKRFKMVTSSTKGLIMRLKLKSGRAGAVASTASSQKVHKPTSSRVPVSKQDNSPRRIKLVHSQKQPEGVNKGNQSGSSRSIVEGGDGGGGGGGGIMEKGSNRGAITRQRSNRVIVSAGGGSGGGGGGGGGDSGEGEWGKHYHEHLSTPDTEHDDTMSVRTLEKETALSSRNDADRTNEICIVDIHSSSEFGVGGCCDCQCIHAHCILSRDVRFALTVTGMHLSQRLSLHSLSLLLSLFLIPPASLGFPRSSRYAYSMKRSGKEDRRFASQRRRQARADSSGDDRNGMLRRRLHSPRHRGNNKQPAVLPTTS